MTDKYGVDSFNIGRPLLNYQIFFSLFSQGVIDTNQLNNALSNSPYFNNPCEIPVWRHLWGWPTLSSESYKKYKLTILKQLDDCKVTHPGEILHIAGILIALEEHGEKFFRGVTLESYFNNYLNKLGLDLVLDLSVMNDYEDIGFAGLSYWSREEIEFIAIKNLVQSSLSNNLESAMKKVADNFVDQMLQDEEIYHALSTRGYQKKYYGDIPFLQHIKIESFVEVLFKDGLLNNVLLDHMMKRYERYRGVIPPFLSTFKSRGLSAMR